jgi:hypothetical protein
MQPASVSRERTGDDGKKMIFHFCRECAVVAYHSND